jgi:hypothetical protein
MTSQVARVEGFRCTFFNQLALSGFRAQTFQYGEVEIRHCSRTLYNAHQISVDALQAHK